MTDLRKDKRAPASLKVKYKSGTVDEFVEQFGTDVSVGGIFIKTKKPIETGALLKLELQLSNASPVIHGVGRVAWRREAAPDPNLPAGMGIKFIKLDPESRTIVDRIIHARGGKPSRFEQTEGAEIAAPSAPPSSPAPAPISATPASAPNAKPAGQRDSVSVSARAALPKPAAPAAQRATPAPAIKPAAPPPPRAPAPRSPSSVSAPLPPPSAMGGAARRMAPTSGAPGVAGLFADSPLVRGSAAPAPEPVPSTGRSSFFPPAPENGASAPSPPPPRPKPVVATKPPRAEQARQSGEFLASAFAEGGVTDAARKPKGAGGGEDALIDQLFADVMDAPPARTSTRPPPAPGSKPAPAPGSVGNVEDVFAALSDEEGLSNPPVARGSAPGAHARTNQSGRSVDDNVDDLFAELNDAQRPARAASSHPPPSPQRRASSPEPESLPTWEEPTSALEEDLQGTTSIPPGAWPSQPPRVTSEPPPPSALTSLEPPRASGRSPLPWILLAVLVAGGAGGYFYYKKTLARQAELGPEPQAQTAEAPATAAQEAAPSAAGTAAPTPEAANTGAAQAAAPGEAVEVEVSSVPRGADVQVDGKPAGVTPLHVAIARGREAQVTVTTAGYAPMTKAVTPGDHTEPLRFKLEPLPFEVRVSADPAGAEISSEDHTAIAPGPLALGHLDGAVQVSISKPGYQRMTRPLRLDEFTEDHGVMRATIEVRLSPLPGGAPVEPPSRPHASSKRSGSHSRSSASSAGGSLSVTPSSAPDEGAGAAPSAAPAAAPADAPPAPAPAAAEPAPAPAPAEPPPAPPAP